MKNKLDKLSSISSSLKKIDDAVKKSTSNYLSKNRKKPLLKQKSTWSILVFLSGFIGLIVSWQQQIKTIEVDTINSNITQIIKFKDSLNKSITDARINFVNQYISCPISSRDSLVKMQQERNRFTWAILSHDSDMQIKESLQIKKVMKNIIWSMYNIKGNKICDLNINNYDKKIKGYNTDIDNILNYEIRRDQNLIEKINKGPLRKISHFFI